MKAKSPRSLCLITIPWSAFIAAVFILIAWPGMQDRIPNAALAAGPSGPAALPGGHIDPAALPLLAQNDLSYIGVFSVPHQDFDGNPLGYSGHALSYNPSHHSLFFGGHDWYQKLCEIGIPPVIDLSQTGSILQNCTDVTEGRLPQIDVDSIKLGGTLLFNGQLIVSAYSYYDADGSQTLSHFVSDPDLSITGEIAGPYQVGDWAGIVSGYMASVPAEWQPIWEAPP